MGLHGGSEASRRYRRMVSVFQYGHTARIWTRLTEWAAVRLKTMSISFQHYELRLRRTTQCLSRSFVGRSSVPPNRAAVDVHLVNPRGGRDWVVEVRSVNDNSRVENDEVGEITLLNFTAPSEAKY